MKIRTDFVTNSSSSSFVCDICGETGIYYDGLGDVDACECENGHRFCREHLFSLSRDELVKYILPNEYYDLKRGGYFQYTIEELNDLSDDELWDIIINCHCEVPESSCPICTFDEYSKRDMVAYLHMKYGVDKDEVFQEIKKLNKRRRKLYDSEYIVYVAKKYDINIAEIPKMWKDTYKSYAEFKNSLKEF